MKPIFFILISIFSPILFYGQSFIGKSYEELDDIATDHFNKGEFEEVVPVIKHLIQKAKQDKQDSILSLWIGNLALINLELGKYEQAEPLFHESLAIRARFFGKKHQSYAMILNNLAGLYKAMGRYDLAEQYHLETIDIRAKTLGRQNRFYGISLNNLGGLYLLLGRYEEAVPLFLEAIKIQENSDDLKPNAHYANALNSLSSCYMSMKEYDKAEPLLLLAAEFDRKFTNKKHPYYSSTTANLAAFYQKTGQFEKSEKTYLETLKLREAAEGKEHASYASALNNLGALYEEMAQFEKAKKMFLAATDIMEKAMGKKHPNTAACLGNLSRIHLKLNQLDAALHYCKHSFAANCAAIDSSFQDFSKLDEFSYYSNNEVIATLLTLLNIVKAQYLQSSDKEKQLLYYKIAASAIRLNEKIKNNYSANENKLRALSSNNRFVSAGLEVLTDLNEKQYLDEAFFFAEQNKSIILSDILKGNRARVVGDLPDSLVLEEIRLQELNDKLKKQQTEAKTDEDIARLNGKMTELNFKIDAFQKKIKADFPKYYALKYEKSNIKAADIQSLLNNKTLFLEYFIGDSSVYLFAIAKDNFQLSKLQCSPKELEEQTNILRNALTNYKEIKENPYKNYAELSQSAYWFYQKLLDELLNGKGYNELIIVADGALGHLPFEVFLSEKPSKTVRLATLPYLVNKYKISYQYSASLWLDNMRNKQNQKQQNNKVLALAASYAGQNDSTAVRANRSPNLRRLRDVLQDLPATKKEVEALAGLFNGSFIHGEKATEGYFKANSKDYGIIHIAMHGILNTQTPILSSLAFTENEDTLNDNFLEAWEISHLKLNAQLVVLSACETGYGKFQQGEGVMSLARSFMYAGVPSLVVSLWQVNDASTSAIMQLFYKNLAKGMDKAEALRQAKLKYIGGSTDAINRVSTAATAHPAYWAPFIIIGDSQPIKIAEKSSGLMYWAIGAISLLALGAGIYALRRKK